YPARLLMGMVMFGGHVVDPLVIVTLLPAWLISIGKRVFRGAYPLGPTERVAQRILSKEMVWRAMERVF
ncbi:MAG TPA: hypothetical protein VN648_06825, partial [Candidatus Methylomirabilis sp.]|nr:hypothetical protein [Candidatus Methylomirabilis sp.]